MDPMTASSYMQFHPVSYPGSTNVYLDSCILDEKVFMKGLLNKQSLAVDWGRTVHGVPMSHEKAVSCGRDIPCGHSSRF